jgi:predicted double-glycine peptidase
MSATETAARLFAGARVPALIASALLALCVTNPAAAQVRLSGEAGGDYEIAVMSWWEIPYRTVVRQQYDFSCGSAAVATLLTYHYDRPTTERVPFASMWEAGNQEMIRKVGFSMLDMKKYLTSVGLKAEGYRLGMEKLDTLKKPAIVLLDLNGFKHFVVLKGVRGDRVLVGDPMRGLSEYSREDFAKIWNGIGLMVVSDDDHPDYNLATDWGPWSTAPMEDGAMRIAADNFATHLPPSYQISPQILLDVDVGTVGQ